MDQNGPFPHSLIHEIEEKEGKKEMKTKKESKNKKVTNQQKEREREREDSKGCIFLTGNGCCSPRLGEEKIIYPPAS